jgi:hypothetical protein
MEPGTRHLSGQQSAIKNANDEADFTALGGFAV